LYYTTDANVWRNPSAPPYPFIVMETAELGALSGYQAEKVKQGRKKFPEEVARLLFTQMLDAVHFLHGHGYIHFDIKLENVCINIRGDVKLIDFGCCREVDEKTGRLELTISEASQLGSKITRAPELTPSGGDMDEEEEEEEEGRERARAASSAPGVVDGSTDHDHDGNSSTNSKLLPVDYRADVWSLGVCLLSMLHGTTELVEDHREELIDDNYSLYLSVWSNVENLLTHRGHFGTSENCADLLASLLCRKPEERLSNIQSIRRHPWLQLRAATNVELAKVLVSNNVQQAEEGFNLVPPGSKDRGCDFYQSLHHALRQNGRLQQPSPIKKTSGRISSAGEGRKKGAAAAAAGDGGGGGGGSGGGGGGGDGGGSGARRLRSSSHSSTQSQRSDTSSPLSIEKSPTPPTRSTTPLRHTLQHHGSNNSRMARSPSDLKSSSVFDVKRHRDR